MATDKKKSPPRAPRSLDEPYIRGDVIPSPVAVEMNSDSAWAMWKEAHAAHEAKFADTAPMSMSSPVSISGDPRYAATQPATLQGESGANPDAPRGPKVKPPTVDDAMLEARKNNRVCPIPARWQELYQMLPDRKNNQPTPPLIGPSWLATPSISKRMCLREHLEWAEAKGSLEPMLAFLKQLPEGEWHHMGD
jgi:hypothetical protein